MRMFRSVSSAALVAAGLLLAPLAHGAAATSWDNLVEVDAKGFDSAYLAPGTDFAPYTKVMIEPAEVAFRRNWLRDYNANAALGARLSDADAAAMLAEIRSGFTEIFTEAYTAAGYTVVTAPGPDVLLIRTSVLDIEIAAPDVSSAGRSRSYAREAGQATLAVEARDSMSGAILARGVDKRDVGDSSFMIERTSVSNHADFARVFRRWADMSADALGHLRALSAKP